MTQERGPHSNQPAAITLFGPVEMGRGSEQAKLSPREKCLLVALVSAKGKTVNRDELPDWIWDRIPDSAATELEKLMTRLRDALGKVGLPDALVNKNRSCRLNIPDDQVDMLRFTALVREAERSEDQRARELLRQALELTRGEPFTGLDTQRVNNYRITLVEERRRVETRFITLEIKLGHAEEQIPELARLFAERREDTTITELYMHALHLARRPIDALDVYKRHREHLDEFGLEVAPSVKDLQLRILRENADQTAEPAADQETLQDARPEPPENTAGTVTQRPARVIHLRQTADHMNVFEEMVDARGAHFGPNYGERSRTVDD